MASKTIASSAAPASAFQAVFLLICLVIAYVLSFVDRQVLSLLVEPVKADLGLNDVELGLLQGMAFSLFFCLAGLPIGWMIDHTNRRNLVIGGILLWSVMTILCGLSNSFLTLFLARTGVGVGEAVLSPAAYSMLADSFRPERLVRALSVYSMAGTAGVGVAFLVGGAAIGAISSMDSVPFDLAPWQATFVIVGAPGFLIALLFLLVREPGRRGSEQDRPTIRETFSLLARRWRDFAPLYACSMLLATVAFGTFVWLPAHVMRAHGLSAASTGYLLGSLILACAIAGAVLGTMLTEGMQKRGYPAAPLRTVLLMALLLIPGAFAAFVADFTTMMILLVVTAIGQSSFHASLVGALQLITPPRMRGINSSLFILVTVMGSLGVGSLIIGAISDGFFPGRPDGLGIAITLTEVTAAALASVIAWRSLPRFGLVLKAGVQGRSPA